LGFRGSRPGAFGMSVQCQQQTCPNLTRIVRYHRSYWNRIFDHSFIRSFVGDCEPRSGFSQRTIGGTWTQMRNGPRRLCSGSLASMRSLAAASPAIAFTYWKVPRAPAKQALPSRRVACKRISRTVRRGELTQPERKLGSASPGTHDRIGRRQPAASHSDRGKGKG
jgi:hypothetical protein